MPKNKKIDEAIDKVEEITNVLIEREYAENTSVVKDEVIIRELYWLNGFLNALEE